jgi:Cys-tRNA(Pro)/Cys-tRNA(Cys) deacylase
MCKRGLLEFHQELVLTMKKTNAARFLDKLKIEYEIREYEVDESDLGAENVARKVGMPLERVFKTLVARGDKTGVIMAVVSGASEVDLKALAFVSGNKKVEMVHLNEVLPLTGYIRGGVSPLGAKKSYPVFLDRTALDQPMIAISAGMRGMQILLKPAELVQAAHATVGDIGRVSGAEIMER